MVSYLVMNPLDSVYELGQGYVHLERLEDHSPVLDPHSEQDSIGFD